MLQVRRPALSAAARPADLRQRASKVQGAKRKGAGRGRRRERAAGKPRSRRARPEAQPGSRSRVPNEEKKYYARELTRWLELIRVQRDPRCLFHRPSSNKCDGAEATVLACQPGGRCTTPLYLSIDFFYPRQQASRRPAAAFCLDWGEKNLGCVRLGTRVRLGTFPPNSK